MATSTGDVQARVSSGTGVVTSSTTGGGSDKQRPGMSQGTSTTATTRPPSMKMSSSATASAPEPLTFNEIGWLFVHEYYTTLNKTPNKLRLFYKTESVMTRGRECAQLPLSFGPSAIAANIEALNLSRCRVLISNVDSQPSAGDGILLQVMGMISNNGGEDVPRRFCQTFFLARQPGGYFVLNDIFRELKEEDEEEGADAEVEAEGGREQLAPGKKLGADRKLPSEPVENPEAAAQSRALKADLEGQAAGETSGVAETSSDKPESEIESTVPTASPAGAVTTATAATATETPPSQSNPSSKAPSAPTSKPSGSGGWASVAASNAGLWGAQVAAESRGQVAQALAPTSVAGSTATTATSAPVPNGASTTPGAASFQTATSSPAARGPPGRTAGGGKPHGGRYQYSEAGDGGSGAAGSATMTTLYVRGWSSRITLSPADLQTLLNEKYGGVKNVDMKNNNADPSVRHVFVEFVSPEMARRVLGEKMMIEDCSVLFTEKRSRQHQYPYHQHQHGGGRPGSTTGLDRGSRGAGGGPGGFAQGYGGGRGRYGDYRRMSQDGGGDRRGAAGGGGNAGSMVTGQASAGSSPSASASAGYPPGGRGAGGSQGFRGHPGFRGGGFRGRGGRGGGGGGAGTAV